MRVGNRICELRTKKGMSQTELGAHCGASKQTIYKYETGVVTNIPLDKIELIAKALDVPPAALMGWEQEETLPDGAERVDLSKYHQIPILGRIAAGLPIYAEEHIEGYTLTDLNHGGEYFALRVRGDSMNAAQIMDGGLVIVRRQEEVESGEVAVVMVEDENATVKRFYRTDTTVTLMPQSTNPEHKPQIYDVTQTKITVLGKVIKAEVLVK